MWEPRSLECKATGTLALRWRHRRILRKRLTLGQAAKFMHLGACSLAPMRWTKRWVASKAEQHLSLA